MPVHRLHVPRDGPGGSRRGDQVSTGPGTRGPRGRVRRHRVRKTIGFGQKHSLTRDFYGSSPSPTSLDTDRWVQREG